MGTEGIALLKKLNVLLAALLCCMFSVVVPAPVHAAPSAEAAQQESIDLTAGNTLVLIAGQTSGEAEAMLQLDRALLVPALQLMLQKLYYEVVCTAPAPHSFPASKGDCGLHIILAQGP